MNVEELDFRSIGTHKTAAVPILKIDFSQIHLKMLKQVKRISTVNNR